MSRTDSSHPETAKRCLTKSMIEMDTGICLITTAAVRMEPDHKREMVTQLLFGERFEILEQTEKWLHIDILRYHYHGWVARNQVEMTDQNTARSLERAGELVTGSHLETVTEAPSGNRFLLSAGSSYYANRDGKMSVNGKTYHYAGELLKGDNADGNNICRHALAFIHTPYLWGGRSAFGMDCSGLVQLVCKMTGITIPRDALVQANHGESIHLINESQPGDLVFFGKDEEEITHIGIIAGDGRVVHAHGLVRIDKIDHHGIFNETLKRYTHKLRLIKRVV